MIMKNSLEIKKLKLVKYSETCQFDHLCTHPFKKTSIIKHQIDKTELHF